MAALVTVERLNLWGIKKYDKAILLDSVSPAGLFSAAVEMIVNRIREVHSASFQVHFSPSAGSS